MYLFNVMKIKKSIICLKSPHHQIRENKKEKTTGDFSVLNNRNTYFLFFRLFSTQELALSSADIFCVKDEHPCFTHAQVLV